MSSPFYDGWEAVQIAGRTYYYCPSTGETSWDLPLGMENQPQAPAQTPSQAPTAPSAVSAARGGEQPVLRLENKPSQKSSLEPKVTGAKTVPSAQKHRAPKKTKPPTRARATSAGTASSSSASSSGEWQATRDPDSGQTYYYHPATGKSSWQKPRTLNVHS